jgi:hypothetical protein
MSSGKIELDLTKPKHRAAVMRAERQLLSEGLDQHEAKAGAVKRALANLEGTRDELR